MKQYTRTFDSKHAAESEGLARQSRQLNMDSFSDDEIKDIAAGNWPQRGEAFRMAARNEAQARGLTAADEPSH